MKIIGCSPKLKRFLLKNGGKMLGSGAIVCSIAAVASAVALGIGLGKLISKHKKEESTIADDIEDREEAKNELKDILIKRGIPAMAFTVGTLAFILCGMKWGSFVVSKKGITALLACAAGGGGSATLASKQEIFRKSKPIAEPDNDNVPAVLIHDCIAEQLGVKENEWYYATEADMLWVILDVHRRVFGRPYSASVNDMWASINDITSDVDGTFDLNVTDPRGNVMWVPYGVLEEWDESLMHFTLVPEVVKGRKCLNFCSNDGLVVEDDNFFSGYKWLKSGKEVHE